MLRKYKNDYIVIALYIHLISPETFQAFTLDATVQKHVEATIFNSCIYTHWNRFFCKDYTALDRCEMLALPLQIQSCEETPLQRGWECGSHWSYLWRSEMSDENGEKHK